MMNRYITELRRYMKDTGADLYYIGTEDFHNSEYVAPYFQLRAIYSGFTGSAGKLLVTEDDARLWTDGRYFLQADQQLKGSGITLMKSGEPGVPSIAEYIADRAEEKHMDDPEAAFVIGLDGRTITSSVLDMYLSEISPDIDVRLEIDKDAAGEILENLGARPELEFHDIVDYDDGFCGVSAADKIRKAEEFLNLHDLDYYIISALDDIAYLLNLRGNDVKYNPVFMSYLLFGNDTDALYCRTDKLQDKAQKKLTSLGVEARPIENFYSDIKKLSGKTGTDPKSSNLLIERAATEGYTVPSFVPMMKAVKNETEISGTRKAHLLDGAALTSFIFWLKNRPTDQQGHLLAEDGSDVTENSAAEKLDEYRSKGENYRGQSFAPIIACGDHGAIVHYSADHESSVPLKKNTFILMDTGGQYLYGTTDVTRTVVAGTPDKEMIKYYTAVMQCHIDLADAVFKKGDRGENLDILARLPLYRLGQDFNHGTGHGVGHYLNVHEDPVRIRSHIYNDDRNSPELRPGMITSDEPGVYLSGRFGIRLENLLLVQEDEDRDGFECFEPLTLAPFEPECIDFSILTVREKEWLARYHRSVYESVGPLVDDNTAGWLENLLKYYDKMAQK